TLSLTLPDKTIQWLPQAKPDALSQALGYLADPADNPDGCANAITTVINRTCRTLHDGANGDCSYSATPSYGYIDPEVLVFDWCYAKLTPDQKTTLFDRIEIFNDQRETFLEAGYFNQSGPHPYPIPFHEAGWSGYYAYVAAVLAVNGEPNTVNRLQNAQN